MTQAPVISSFSPDTGNPDTTDQDVLTFVGVAPDNSTVDVYSGSTLLGATIASSTGAWSFTTSALANGIYSFTATDIVAGVTSAASAPLVVNVVPATTVTKVAASPGSGTEFSGDKITLTLEMTAPVMVTGTPTLTLNNGGTATYSGGSGTNALTFSYIVAAGQNTASLAAVALNLNSATVTDSAGNAANLSLIGLTQSGPATVTVGLPPSPALALPDPPSVPCGSGNQYWVSPNGSDTADGLSQATAFKTLQRAESVTNPGDVVNVLPGTYTAPNARDVLQINRAGSAAGWITYKAAPGAKIQVSPNNWMGVEVLAPYIIVQGFEIIGNARNVTMDFALQHAQDGTIPQTNSYGLGIGSHHVRILDNKIHDNSGHGIGGGGDYVVISGNEVYGNGNWSPYATGGVSQVQQGAQQFDDAPGYHNFIIGNSIHDNVELIGNAWAGGAITDGNGIIIDSNQLGTTPYTGRTLISNNVLTDNGAAGVLVYQSAHVDVFSNTSVNNNFNVKEGEILAAKASDVRMFSNIMLARSGSYATGGGYADTNVTYDYNVVSGPATYGATPHGPQDILADSPLGGSGSWTPIGAVQNRSGYEVAAQNTSTGQYTVWTTDYNGNYTGTVIGAVSGITAPLVIQTNTSSFGSTSLAQVGNNYFLFATGGTTGPELQYNSSAVTSGEFGSWNPIGAVQTANGYEVAWQNASTGQYTVWRTDSNGNYTGNVIGAVAGNGYALESFESVFNQDLNGDGVTGLNPLVIHTDTSSLGSTSLAQIGNNYFLFATGGTTGPELQFNSSAITSGEFGSWNPIGAVQTANGYEVAWQNASTGLYTVWRTDSNGNYTGNVIGAVAGNGYALESFESVFNQDLNGDGVTGLNPLVIQTDTSSLGSTSLAQIGNNYFLFATGGTTGPELQFNSSAITSGEFGSWNPIGAVQTANGYEVACQNAGTGLYTVWRTDSNGNYTGNVIGAVAGNGYALESFESVFNQDLNGDGVTGLNPLVIHTDTSSLGSTSLAQIGNNYFLFATGGTTGPELQFNSSAVTSSEFGSWNPIGAVQTANGYEVAWQNASTGLYTVWTTDSNGNYTRNVIGAVAGNGYALESFESVFNQDLNGDGVTSLYAATGTTLKVTQSLAATSTAATIASGGTLELDVADSTSVTFAASTGQLRLDQPSSFTGEIFNFSGDGALAGSDQIDLQGINYNTVQDAYAAGVLTVTDGSGNSARLNFSGSYTLANFSLASDGAGGTIVYDPPVATSNARTSAPRSATIDNGAMLESVIGDTGSVKGTSILDHFASVRPDFNIKPIGLGLGGQNDVDLNGLAFDTHTTLGYSPTSNFIGDPQSLSESLCSANIALLGNYMASVSTFAIPSDGHCETMIGEATMPNGQSLLSNPHHA